jgi:limonene-1,2-epoxide hydrolase
MNPPKSQTTSLANTESQPSPTSVVRQFLDLLAKGDLDGAVDLLDEDVDYINVSLPTIRGRDRVRRVFKALEKANGAGFEVYFHGISEDGGTVLTERTDVLIWGPMRAQIWVCGRFDVRDGQITLWKDYFDWLNATLAMVRGLIGIVFPSVKAKPPMAG